jgi:hypothetical protein
MIQLFLSHGYCLVGLLLLLMPGYSFSLVAFSFSKDRNTGGYFQRGKAAEV